MKIRARGPRGWALVVAAAMSVVSSPILLGQTAQAAGSSVSINELMYNPGSDLDGDEFLELMNTDVVRGRHVGLDASAASRDASAWYDDRGQRVLRVSPDATRFAATYGGAPDAIYTGKLSNGGETVSCQGRQRPSSSTR